MDNITGIDGFIGGAYKTLNAAHSLSQEMEKSIVTATSDCL